MDGILIVNKPKGYTSHDIVNILRKELNIKKIGHTGTLDPNATGVLPILVGQATKISKYLIEHNKEYIAELKLGEKTSTGDPEGETIEIQETPKLEEKQIQEVLNSFLGKQKQTPPIYSSIKVNGKKAYEYAREGKPVELEPRPIEILYISLIKFEKNIITFKVKCSKGTYIRVLCEDIAKKIGTVGLMQNLCRTEVDNFKLENSVTIEEIKENGKEFIDQKIIPIEEVFTTTPKIILSMKKTELFLNGVQLTNEFQDGVYKVYNQEKFLGLGIVKDNLLKRDVIILRHIDILQNNV